jgi:quinoprotein glucose dehydrogenase
MSLDEARGLLYLPTSTPGSDYYGALRPGANLLAESLVCLDAATGQRKWHFQAVHHGLWDYDFTSPPNLATITVNGRRIDAVAEVSKQGFTYVFDRVTGQPVWPIEERPVETTTDVPGEKPWPTQPFPTRPPAFTPQGVSLDDANDLTPQIKALAQAEMKKYRLGPLFTPPSLRGTLQRPTNGGGANWGGAAFDAETGYLFVRATNGVYISAVAPNDHSDPNILAPYSDWLVPPRNSGPLAGLPMIKPPYGTLTAINLNKGEIAWQAPLGEGSASLRHHRLLAGVTLPARLGSGGSGGALVIGSGLVLVGGGDKYLYAFDKNTGREVWRGAIPFTTAALPMTYRTRSGRQFIAVATGAGPDAALVAFALGPQ